MLMLNENKNIGQQMKIKRVLLAEAQHQRLHSAFGWVRPKCLLLGECVPA